MCQDKIIIIDVQGFYSENKFIPKKEYKNRLYNHFHGLRWDDGSSKLTDVEEYLKLSIKNPTNYKKSLIILIHTCKNNTLSQNKLPITKIHNAQGTAQLTTYDGRVYLASNIVLQHHHNNTLENPNTNVHLEPPSSTKLSRMSFGAHSDAFGSAQTPKKV
uniref:Uncharacterized protein n=1 Tax=Glossina palpalis gambiensis TaxID=67801 RepID=A0A1B0BNQ9_9MUSC